MGWTSNLMFTDCSTHAPLAGVVISGTANGTTDGAGQVTLVVADDDLPSVVVSAAKPGYETSPNIELVNHGDQPFEESYCLTPFGSGSGGGGLSISCFISTAAFGSPLAEELKFQHQIRDEVLLQTQWGRDWWEEWNRYYTRISPPIAAEMDNDSRLRDLVRWGIVQPWLQYMHLVLAHPDWSTVEFERLPPDVREFLHELRRGMDAWLAEIELPKTLSDRDTDDAVRELDVILTYGTGGHSAMYLRHLAEQGELPLEMPDGERRRQRAILEDHRHHPADIDMILGPAS